MLNFVCVSIEVSIELFSFPCLFSGYFCAADACFDLIASDGGNKSSSIHGYVIWEVLYRCIDAIFNAGKSSSFLTHIDGMRRRSNVSSYYL